MDNLFGLDLPALREKLSSLNLPGYRAVQLAEWMYQKDAASFDEMTNLPKALRASLGESFSVERAHCLERWDSADGKTSKFLLAFSDGVAVETVLMRQPYGNSICVSTQAGCAMGCAFCASTLHGVERSLTAGEMLGEACFIDGLLKKEGQKVDTMVLMGSGFVALAFTHDLSQAAMWFAL